MAHLLKSLKIKQTVMFVRWCTARKSKNCNCPWKLFWFSFTNEIWSRHFVMCGIMALKIYDVMQRTNFWDLLLRCWSSEDEISPSPSTPTMWICLLPEPWYVTWLVQQLIIWQIYVPITVVVLVPLDERRHFHHIISDHWVKRRNISKRGHSRRKFDNCGLGNRRRI